MTFSVKSTKIRTILNSKGLPAAEVEMYLTDGSFGRASAPQGVSTGRREQKVSCLLSSDVPLSLDFQSKSTCKFFSQADFDSMLENKSNELGSDVMLAYSLAFARACS